MGFFATASPRRAGVVVGIAFLTSVVFVTLVDDVLLSNFVVPGDTGALAQDIAADPATFRLAAIGYLIVLILDALIGAALYIVLRPANARLALLTGALRILYAVALILGVLALLLGMIDAFAYAEIKLWGYVAFAVHLLTLGYAVLMSGYLPKLLGALLILAALCYAVFFIDAELSEPILVTAMLTMALGEVALSVWLLVKRRSLPDAP